jgi:hypothetical protein
MTGRIKMQAISIALLRPENPRGAPHFCATSRLRNRGNNAIHEQASQRGMVDHQRGMRAKRQHGKTMIASK